MTEIHWINQRGYCEGPHPYIYEGKWRYPKGRTAIRKFIKSNGVTNYELVCAVNGCRYKSSPIPNSGAESLLGKLPIIEPRYSSAPEHICGYQGCQSTEVEWHHYAPYNTFGREADNYPCLPLCRAHHRYWHQQMNGYEWNRRTGIDCDGCGATARKGHQCFCGKTPAV